MAHGFTWLSLATILWLTCLCHSTNAFTLHFNDTTTKEIKALYSTVGDHIENITVKSLAVISKSDLKIKDGDCSPLLRIRDRIAGKVIFYDGTLFDSLLFHKCIKNDYTLGLLFAKMAQDAGAFGIITEIPAQEKSYKGGRVTGFSDKVTITYLVTHKDNIDFMAEHIDSISSIELPPISQSDKDLLRELKNIFDGLVIFTKVIYAILTVLLGYIIIREILELKESNFKKINYHRASLTLACFFNSALNFIWIWDPVSFSLSRTFPSLALYFLILGSTIVILLLMLKIWIKASGERMMSKRVTYLLYIVNGATTLMILTSIICAILWYYTILILIYSFVGLLCAILFICGYAYYGRNIVRVLLKSGNFDNSRNRMMSLKVIRSLKIIITATIFVVTGLLGIIIFESGACGGTIGDLVGSDIAFFGIFACFMLLYFKQQKKRTSRRFVESPVPANATPTRSKDSGNSAEHSAGSQPMSEISTGSPPSSAVSTTNADNFTDISSV